MGRIRLVFDRLLGLCQLKQLEGLINVVILRMGQIMATLKQVEDAIAAQKTVVAGKLQALKDEVAAQAASIESLKAQVAAGASIPDSVVAGIGEIGVDAVVAPVVPPVTPLNPA